MASVGELSMRGSTQCCEEAKPGQTGQAPERPAATFWWNKHAAAPQKQHLAQLHARRPSPQPQPQPAHLRELLWQRHARGLPLLHPAALLALQARLHRRRVGLLRLELARQLLQGSLRGRREGG